MDRKCEICNCIPENWSHKSSDLHRFNFLLFEWNQYRKSLVQNRNGVKIEQRINGDEIKETETTYNKAKGSFIIKLSSAKHSSLRNGVSCSFTIENERRNDKVCLMKVTVLHPHYDDAVTIQDRLNIFKNNKVLELEPKQQYEVTAQINLKVTAVGSYKIPLAFLFQVYGKNEIDCFTFAREIIIVMSDYDDVIKDEGKSPFKNSVWKNIRFTVPPMRDMFETNFFPIPSKYFSVLMAGLNDSDRFDENDLEMLDYIRKIFDPCFCNTEKLVPQFPTPENYQDFFHILLWLDEIGQRLMLQRYNMSNVTMKIVQDNLLELEVPGLAEKRPSLLAGDLIKIRFHEDHTVYEGCIKTVNDKTIWIHHVDNELISHIQQNEEIELDVSFKLSRLPYERKHSAVDDCVKKGLLNLLFPVMPSKCKSLKITIQISDDKFNNQNILRNREQKTAVLNILNGTSRNAPYIVFGPPGTGKTVTIVEAILQIKANLKSCKILVCAPANAACDMLTSKLIPFCKKRELIRIYACSRNCNDVPNDIKPYSNYDEDFRRIPAEEVATYQIVITTLVLIGKYSGQFTPDYVFIDEAAQAMEPEADIAISLMSQAKHLVLAGDPKQLGPLVSSKVAAELKLGVSLLERLMMTNSLYKDGHTNFITMLKLNYRSHPTVLQVPNELFYENKLVAINSMPNDDPISKLFIYPRMLPDGQQNTKEIEDPKEMGEAIEFYAVFAKEQRQGKSPSYFNESEIQTVMKCVKALLSLPQTRVSQSDIGVVTPYIRQVHRIKQRLEQHKLTDIEVGTPEVYQGREKRIIIVTTVRAQHSFLLFDKRYKLGFVSNEKRFNVALTRAMSKLIVTGNPLVLGTDKNWLRYIELCEEKGAYFGRQYTRRTDAVKKDISQRMKNIKFNKNN